MKKNKSIKYKKQLGGIGTVVPLMEQAITPLIQSTINPSHIKTIIPQTIDPSVTLAKSIHNASSNEGANEILSFIKKMKKKFVNAIWWRNFFTIVVSIIVYTVSLIGALIGFVIASLPTLAIAATVIIILELVIITLNLIIVGFYKKVLKPISTIIPMRLKRPKTIPHSWIILWMLIKSIIRQISPNFANKLDKIKTSKSFIDYNAVIKKDERTK